MDLASSSSTTVPSTKKRPAELKIDTLNTKHIYHNDVEERINIRFKSVSYGVKEGIFNKNRKMLLNKLNGEFYSSELTAIMGPSGAGKSTLMNILAGYTTHNFTGKIYTNDKIRDLALFRKRSCYIMQDDHLQQLLTVEEAMNVAANLKLPNSLTKMEKYEKVKEILLSVDLWPKCNIKTKNLSGGQKKRLSIALELISDPQIMFFDEPTSGLDVVTSKQCILLLKELATLNRTIICTIHQPSAIILDLFDHLYVVSNGFCAYQGDVKELIPYLNENSLVCPTYHNPSDFLLEVLNGDHGQYTHALVEKSKNGLDNQWRNRINYYYSSRFEMTPSPVSPSTPSFNEVKKFMKSKSCAANTYSTSCAYQILILTQRAFKVISRDKTLTYNRLFTHFGIGLLIGILYFGIGVDAYDMLNNFKFMFFTVMFLMLTSFNCITTTFPFELPVITREHFNKWYSLKSYYLALTLADIPVQILATLIYAIITYLLTQQPIELFRILSFLFMCVLISLVSQSFGLFIGACMNVTNGVIFGPFCVLPFTIFSGFFVQLNACHPSLRWLFHISFIKYGFEGLVLSVLGYNRPKLPCSSHYYCHYSDPKKALITMDMNNSTYSLAVIFLISLIVLIRICAYYALKLKVQYSKGRR